MGTLETNMHVHTSEENTKKKDLPFIYFYRRIERRKKMRAKRCCAIKNTASTEIAHPQPKASLPSYPITRRKNRQIKDSRRYTNDVVSTSTKRERKKKEKKERKTDAGGTAIKTVGMLRVHMTKQHLSCFANPIHQAPQKQPAAVLTRWWESPRR